MPGKDKEIEGSMIEKKKLSASLSERIKKSMFDFLLLARPLFVDLTSLFGLFPPFLLRYFSEFLLLRPRLILNCTKISSLFY